jgi:hypothetical protein
MVVDEVVMEVLKDTIENGAGHFTARIRQYAMFEDAAFSVALKMDTPRHKTPAPLPVGNNKWVTVYVTLSNNDDPKMQTNTVVECNQRTEIEVAHLVALRAKQLMQQLYDQALEGIA